MEYAAADVDRLRMGISGEILCEATKLAGEDVLRGFLDPHRFTLETALDAHHAIESGTPAGKIVVDVTTWFRLRGRDIK